MTYTPRGPKRWDRAALNALRHPHTEAGKLFLKRQKFALEVAAVAPNPRQPYAFTQRVYRQSTNTYERAPVYYACSVYCTMMQAQLDMHPAYITLAFTPADESTRPYAFKLVPQRPVRERRCQVCGTTIRREEVKK